ncbi:sulfotransferase family protein [Marinobacter sp.]|uniref:sulfotransferase family protein n=1 Tax=Marinobacter sp. TaxID=50741 RepID=UPI00384B9CE4
MKKPNAFIVGAPKCGTTAMHEYLSQHPDVYACKPKEPHYFIQGDFPKWWKITEEEYLSLFSSAKKEKILLDSSVWYLYSKNSLRKIYEFNQDAKIIIILRNPVEMVHACHGENYKNRQDDQKTIKDSWELIEDRKKGKYIPSTCRAEQLLYYDEVAGYKVQVECALQHFNRDQVHIILFDDFKSNPSKVFECALNFLDIKTFKEMDFSPVNKSKTIHSSIVGDLTRGHPKLVFDVYRFLKKKIGLNGIGLMKKIRQINEHEKKRDPLPSELGIRIINNYREDIEYIEDLMGRDLSAWKTIP